jgi:signal transduction histidine kinase/ligand-binding sensor domain-containing protein
MKVAADSNSKSGCAPGWPFGCMLLLLLSLVPGACLGQSESFSINSWGTRNGLPEMAVQSLAVKPDGGLLVGTAGGLCLFDGSYCKPLQNQEINKFPASNLTALLQEHDQSLWAGTEGGGLLHITSDHVEIFDQRNGLGDLYIRAIFEDSMGNLWVGTDDGLFRRSGSVFQKVILPNNRGRQDVYALAEDSQHRLIVGGSALFYLNESDNSFLPPLEEPLPYPIRSLLVTREGRLILGTLGGVFERVGARYIRLPFPNGDVERLCQSADSAIWAGTVSNGLWRMKDGKPSRIHIGNDDRGQSVLAMSADASGRLWVGTEIGLSRIEPTNVHLIESPAAAVDSETLAISPKGKALLVNSQVYRLDNGEPRPLRFQLPGKPKALLNVLYASDRSIWLGTSGNGVYRLDSDGHATQYSTYSRVKIAGDFPRGIVEGVNGDIWIATAFGLNRIAHDGVEQFGALNGLPNRNVRALLRDRKGCMWIGTDGGLAAYCGGLFVQSRATKTLRGEEISAITEDSSGTIWLGTRNHGIYAYRGSDLRHFSTSDGLLSNFICGLAADKKGTLWISSPEAISSMPVDQTLGEPRNTDLVFAKPSSLPNGAENLRFSGGRFPNILVDDRGIVWFATTRGPVYIDNSLPVLNRASEAPVPVIVSVLADDAYIQRAHPTKIPSDSKLLTFTFGSIYLGSEQDLLLTYRLEGVDEKWTVSSGSHQVEYRGLPAGSYTFDLRAYSRSQPDTANSARISFIVPVIWYRSRWFYIMVLPSLAIVFLLIYMLHLQRIKGRFRLILEERTRLAREMHDTLIQGCNGVAMLLEAEASSRGRLESEYLDVAREQLQVTVADARKAVWNLRQTEMDSDRIIASLKNISAQASESFGIPIVVSHPVRLPRVPSDAAHEVLMIVREAVTNAGSHGHPRTIDIIAQHTENHLLLRIADDGIGFDVDALSTLSDDHYGILGMHERAEMIGANLEITSSQGAGTSVQISLKIGS